MKCLSVIFLCLSGASFDFSNMLKNQLIDLKGIYQPATNMPTYSHLFQGLSVLQGMRWLCQHVLTFWECLAFSEACRVRRELPDAELHFGCIIPKGRAGKCVCTDLLATLSSEWRRNLQYLTYTARHNIA